MLRFKNRLNVSIAPHVWVSPDGSRRIPWRSDTMLFPAFHGIVVAYCEANNLKPPTSEELEDLMCRQSPSRDCTGEAVGHQRPVANTRSPGCSSCNKRRK